MASTFEHTHGGPALSLAEWLVLCLVCEEPQHGFAIARLLDSDGSLGRIWRVPKPVVYRSVQRLEQLGLVRSAELQPSRQGPAKSPIDATSAGSPSRGLTGPPTTTGTCDRSFSRSSR